MVTNNEAHGLIERGEAKIVISGPGKNTREMTPRRAKDYKTK